MYSFKEKKRHFSDLKNTSAAESDLLLLKSKVKQVISSWERQPKRYADDILYRLLDVATREEIRINRREQMKVQEESSTGDETKDPVDNSVSRKGSEIDVYDTPSQKSDDNDVQKRISEAEAAKEEAENRAEEAEAALVKAEERAEEAESALEEAEERAEEAESALEEAEERAEEAETALEEEKKKEPNPESPTRKAGKSKSKKSTRK